MHWYQHTVDSLRRDIETNLDTAAKVCRMIEVNQTRDERRTATTIHDNDQGFSQADAPYLQPIADKLWTGMDPRDLAGQEKVILKAYTAKYAAQYLEFSRYYYRLNNPIC